MCKLGQESREYFEIVALVVKERLQLVDEHISELALRHAHYSSMLVLHS